MAKYPDSVGRASLQGVLYAEDFDADPAVPAGATHEPEVIEPMFSGAEMDAARAEAHRAGRTECEHGIAAARLRLLGTIAGAMQDAATAAQDVARAHADALAPVFLSALAACLPALCARNGAAELTAFTRAVLPSLTEEPRVLIRVNPIMLASMQDEASAMDPDLAARIDWIATEAMPPGDARISWQDGHAVRDAGRARRAMMDVLATLGLLQPENVDA